MCSIFLSAVAHKRSGTLFLVLLLILSSGGWAHAAPDFVVPSAERLCAASFHQRSHINVPVVHQSRAVTFIAKISGIQSVRLEVFDLAGQRIFHSGSAPGATYKWHLQRSDGKIAANGVYLYIVTSRTADNKEIRSAVGKLAVRR